MQTLIEAENLVFTRRQKAILNGVSMTLHCGEVVALVGANGVGKTTLLHILAGYIQPDDGRVQRHCKCAHIALLADKAALYPQWTVKEALLRIARLYGAPRAQVDKLLHEFELEAVCLHKACDLSHGYRQRLAMAQILLADPRIIMLDEPGNGLDYRQKRALWPLLARLKTRAGVLLISHDWSEVAAVADRVYLLSSGACQEIIMPPHADHWRWLTCIDAASAATIAQAVYVQGRFVAVEAADIDYGRQVVAISRDYPAEALQEAIDALV